MKSLILLATTDRALRDDVIRALPADDYEIITEPVSALDGALQHKADLMLIDAIQPQQDVLQMLRQLRAREEAQNISVIVLAEANDEEEKTAYLKAGAYAYMVKPLDARELEMRIEIGIEIARVRREADAIVRESDRESKMRLTLALQAGRAGTFEWDIKNNINRWSPEIEAMYGVPVGTFEGDFESWAKRVEPTDAQIVMAEIESALAQHKSEREYEFRAILPDGTRRWFAGRARFEYDADGVPLRMLGINVDINERKQHNEEREKLLEREREARHDAEKANRLKDEFLATVSHELRTPLTAVIGWTHLLRAGTLDEKNTIRALETIERNAQAQNQLIEDLLDVSRIITGKLRLDVRSIEPSAFIEAAIEAVQPAAAAKNVRIQKVMDTGVGVLSGDADRLQQVVWNLLSNAIKFTPRGGRVQVRLERINSHIEIIVNDTGQGIAPEFLPFVFDRFRQADGTTARLHGGLGLGLSIVRHLVELHGGTVHAESHGANQGATFTIKLPLIHVYLDQNQANEERVHPRARQTLSTIECPERLDDLMILVVDDEPDTCALLKVMLEQCGATVKMAVSGDDALVQLEATGFDVLISDIGMPNSDGYDLIKRVRGLPSDRNGRVPAIALTAYARSNDRLQAIRAGYQMHVPKPVESAELIAIVASLARRAHD